MRGGLDYARQVVAMPLSRGQRMILAYRLHRRAQYVDVSRQHVFVMTPRRLAVRNNAAQDPT